MNDQKRITHPELIAMARERGNERLPEFKKASARGKARNKTSETNEKGRKEAEKGTPGQSRKSGRNDDDISEYQQGGADIGEIRHADLQDGCDRRKR